MDYLTLINKTRESFNTSRVNLSKNEIKYLSGRSDFRSSFIDLFSLRYFKKKKLILEGNIYYSYIIRIYRSNLNQEDAISSWLIFSPESIFDSSPEIYQKINDNILKFIENKENQKTNRKLYNALTLELSEPRYLELSEDLSEGHLVYLSFAYLRKNHLPNTKLGLNLIIANKKISDEIMYLPLDYCLVEYRNNYLKNCEMQELKSPQKEDISQ